MTDLKKIGLSALAGSLAAFSANAGELSVSGGAKLSYTADTGVSDVQDDGNRFGMQQLMSFTGSGELDNGHTVSLAHYMTSGGAKSSSALTYDMGDMGSITYQDVSGDLGLGKIDDVMPTAVEEIWDGLDTNEATALGTPNGRVDAGQTGFNYNASYDMVTVNVGYSPKTGAAGNDDGGNQGTGANISTTSFAVQLSPMDGLNVYAGMGDKGGALASDESEMDTMAVTYAYGPATVGYQVSNIDVQAASSDLETTAMSVAFAVNENLSISYGQSETEKDGSTVDQEIKGVSVGYSMGGISIAAHQNEVENMKQASGTESEHTEISVSFAF
jgi:outer membrane protein OmpU